MNHIDALRQQDRIRRIRLDAQDLCSRMEDELVDLAPDFLCRESGCVAVRPLGDIWCLMHQEMHEQISEEAGREALPY